MKKLACIRIFSIILPFALLVLGSCQKKVNTPSNSSEKSIVLAPERAREIASGIRETINVEVHPGLKLDLWASDSLIADPIAISIDPSGNIYYTSATRQANSEFDIRSHRNWMTASISFQTIEDRSAFLRKTFSETNEEGEKALKDLNKDGILDWKDLTVEKEQVWVVSDASGDGVADQSKLYLEDFHEEITDVANGIEYAEGVVYLGVGPDFWRTEDLDGDGMADRTQSLSRGYAVHIGFSGHGMSGAIMGPDGRIWWGIGDIGANVIDQTGKQWKYPNRGVIARSELDGSSFEIYCFGVRNTHEFVFDKYGNLISVDNDGDHSGERERLVHLINGSETGWRINWQFGKYTDAKNNKYKVWMDEKMHVPHWDGQAAYFLPPIQNYINGPTGMVFNPGTALGPEWYNHFFIAEFRGSPANSPVHAFTLNPKGASFVLDETKEIVKGLLPTGLDWGPGGALYFGDWIDGWGTKDAGRIWKIDVPGGSRSAIRLETKQLIEANFGVKELDTLKYYLGHMDMRVRQKAQFEIARRGQDGIIAFKEVLAEVDHQLARIHALWGIGQLCRSTNRAYADAFIPFLKDNDDEIKAQAAKMLGDVKYTESAEDIIPLLGHKSLRVKMLAVEALGRMKSTSAVQAILDVLAENDDQDLWLRHAGMIALGRIGDEEALVGLKGHPLKALRTVAVVALRRMQSPGVSIFLQDDSEFIVTEAARAINDDFSINEALPDLAGTLNQTKFQNEALIRRAINANIRVGTSESITALTEYAMRPSAPSKMRAEALDALRHWANPSVFDRVDGRYRGEINRDDAPLKATLTPLLTDLLKSKDAYVQAASARIAAQLFASNQAPNLMEMLEKNPSHIARIAALRALSDLNSPTLPNALKMAIEDKDERVRAVGLEILPTSNIEESTAVSLFEKILDMGSSTEKQAIFGAMGKLKGKEAVATLAKWLDRYIAGQVDSELHLDIVEAVREQGEQASLSTLDSFESVQLKEDTLAAFRPALSGGDEKRGHDIFYEHESAQCVRCHTVFEYGGNAGPGLAGVADRLTPEELLESIVYPSASFASGYEVVSLEMNNGSIVAGVIADENDEQVVLKIGKETKAVNQADIKERISIPSSMLPMGEILSKRQIRDVIAFLGTLRSEG